ncbi:MAG: TonB-dependent receptor [Hyphomonadaceae bacterium]
MALFQSDRASGRKFASIMLSSAAALSISGLGGAAFAQDAEDGESGVGEIVVTAQRYEQNLQETPLSVVAVGAEQLDALGVSSLSGFDTFVPNVSIGGTAGQGGAVANFAIRGIGGAPSGFVTQESSVGVYIDDILFARPNGALLDLLDVERVEVLRGPQGTLFGRNTAGGAVRYVTHQPSQELEGNIRVGVGSYDRRDISGVLNIPLGDTFAARISFANKDREGYIDRIIDGGATGAEHSETFRLQLRAHPTDQLDINFSVDSIRTNNNGSATIIGEYSATDIYTAALYGAQIPGGPPVNVAAVNSMRALMPASVSPSNYCGQGLVLAAPVTLASVSACALSDLQSYYDQDGQYSVYGGTPDINEFESLGLALSVSYDLTDTVTFNSHTGYRTSDQFQFQDWDRTPIPLVQLGETINIEYFTQEFQLIGTSFDDRLRWQAGVFYYDDQADDFRRRFDPSGGANSASEGLAGIGRGQIENKFISTTSLAAYAQGTFNFTDQLSATLGVRWTQDEKDYASFRDGRGRVPVGTPPVLTPQRQSVSGEWENFSPRIGLEYRWTPDIMTYVSAAQGFKGGGFNDTLQSTCNAAALPGDPLYNCGLSEFNEENLVTYEAGLRSDWFNNRVRFNATYFSTTYEDQQIQLIDSGPPPLQYTTNGDATVEGVELEFMAAITDQLLLRANAGWVDASYDQVILGRSGAVAITPDVPYFRSPELSYSVGVNYTVPWASVGDVIFDLNYGYKDEQASYPNPGNMVILPAYGLLNGRVELRSLNGWSISLIGTNLLDEYYLTNGFDPAGPATKPTPGIPGGLHDTVFGFEMLDVGRPQEFGVEFRYEF